MPTNMSSEFMEVFDSGGSGCHRECACGRVHFDTQDGYDCEWYDTEVPELRVLAHSHPDKYFERDYSVGCIVINNKEIVFDCVCEEAQKYENFIKWDAENIAKYLNMTAKMMEEEAESIKVG
jgi:hypothetical protein